MRKLAECTASSTTDISNMVSNIHAVSQSAVVSMHEAIREVENEAVIVHENGETLKKIMDAGRQVAGNAQHIADAYVISREPAPMSPVILSAYPTWLTVMCALRKMLGKHPVRCPNPQLNCRR